MEWRSTFPTVSLLMLMLMSALASNQAQAQHVFDIKDFGAVADGKTDNSKAFSDAWDGACHSNGTSVVLIPSGAYVLGPAQLAGPCNGAIEFQIKGGLRAFDSPQLISTIGLHSGSLTT
ncbi:hypothetical protein NL676_024421 [Syzygium grande]|nr:hypothetical protein NL676_024421 [Syzygium grande]